MEDHISKNVWLHRLAAMGKTKVVHKVGWVGNGGLSWEELGKEIRMIKTHYKILKELMKFRKKERKIY